MKLISKIVGTIFGFILVGGLGVGGYFSVKLIAERFARMDFQVATVTAIASVVALLAAVIVASSIRLASRENRANQLRAEKAATYQLFIDLWGDIVRQGRGTEDRSLNKLSEELQTLDRLLILYGSPVVVKAHAALQALRRGSGAQNPTVRSQLAKALMEIRKDLGSVTQGLTAQELEQLLLANFDKVSASAKADSHQDYQPRVSIASNS
jgi:hypothetical protein